MKEVKNYTTIKECVDRLSAIGDMIHYNYADNQTAELLDMIGNKITELYNMSFVSKPINTHASEKKENNIECYGARSHAIGEDAKLVPSGICNHPNKRFVKKEYLDGLPIPEFAWTHCIFCKNDGNCYFAGNCDHRIEINEEE